MARIISFFQSQEEATRAVDDLYSGDYEGIETEVIENASEIDFGAEGIVAPATNASTGVAGAIGIPTRLEDIDFDDEKEAAWFAEGVRGGGVLVMAEVDDEDATAVEQVLRNHGGRTFEKA